MDVGVVVVTATVVVEGFVFEYLGWIDCLGTDVDILNVGGIGEIVQEEW